MQVFHTNIPKEYIQGKKAIKNKKYEVNKILLVKNKKITKA
ncbi:MAG: hypothetical protein ACTSWN_16455 [Promethearchaeota archaeon]